MRKDYPADRHSTTLQKIIRPRGGGGVGSLLATERKSNNETAHKKKIKIKIKKKSCSFAFVVLKHMSVNLCS